MSSKTADKDKSKVHKLALKGSAKLVAEFVCINFLISELLISEALDESTSNVIICSFNTRSIQFCT